MKGDAKCFVYYNYLCIYKEADRVAQLFCKVQLPILHYHRQRRCIPINYAKRDATIEKAIEQRQIQKAKLDQEPEVLFAKVQGL
jgi:hypothetical protein